MGRLKKCFCFCGETSPRQPELGYENENAPCSPSQSYTLNDCWTRLSFPNLNPGDTGEIINKKLGILLERYFHHMGVNAPPNGRSWAQLANETIAQTGLGENYPTLFCNLHNLASEQTETFLLGANKIRLHWGNVGAYPTIEVPSVLLPFCIGCFLCGTCFDLTQIMSAPEILFTETNAAGAWEIQPVAEDTAQAAFDPLGKKHPEGASTGAIIAGALLLAILLTKAVVQGFG